MEWPCSRSVWKPGMSQRVSDDFVPTLLYFDTNIFFVYFL
jgi:hypothetical protein